MALLRSRTHRLFFVGALFALSVVASAAATPRYEVTIEPQFGELKYDGLLILTDPAFGHVYPASPRGLMVSMTPEPPSFPKVDWSAIGGVQVSPEVVGRPSNRNLDYAGLDRNNVIGPFTIAARIGPPVNARAEIKGFAYEQIAMGCASGFPGGMRLDSHGIPHESEKPEDADMYVTGPPEDEARIDDRCADDFHDPAASHYTLHVPGGGVEVDAGPSRFPAVTAQGWGKAAVTSFDMRHLAGTLVWRTRDGRLVTSLDRAGSEAFIGPMLIANEDETFADNFVAGVNRP